MRKHLACKLRHLSPHRYTDIDPSPMPCSAAELPIAKEAVALYAAGDTDSALAKLGELQGGKGGTCSSCLLAHTDAPTECMCVRL